MYICVYDCFDLLKNLNFSDNINALNCNTSHAPRSRSLQEKPVVPASPQPVALGQQLLEIANGLDDGPPVLGH